MNNFVNKKILVLGGTGSVGTEIVKQLIRYGVSKLSVYARDESKHQYLFDCLGKPQNFKSIIGDIRDKERLRTVMPNIDIVINAAALKSVPYCEENPFEAIQTNLVGTQNIIDVALENNVEKVISISTDKAADPISAYGITKLLSEKLLIAAEFHKGNNNTIFTAVRLGNVLGARNSVLPVIRNQILNDCPITVTDSNMTRFIMSTNEAVQLILNALTLSKGGEIFINKMRALYVWDLINVYIEKLCEKHKINFKKIKRVYIPPRSGEKSYERLFSEYEEKSVYDLKSVLAIFPCQNIMNKSISKRAYKDISKISSFVEYNSATVSKLTKEEISTLLSNENLIY